MFRDMMAGVLWGGYNVPRHGGRRSLVDTMFRDMVAGVLWWLQCSVTWWQAFSGGYNVP